MCKCVYMGEGKLHGQAKYVCDLESIRGGAGGEGHKTDTVFV